MSSLEKAEKLLLTKEWMVLTARVRRYGDYKEMIHRPDLWTHIRRTAYLAEAIGKYLNGLEHSPFKIDTKKAFNMGYHHDDTEFVLPDINSQVKHNFTQEQKKELRDREEAAIRALAILFFGYDKKSPKYQEYLALHQEREQKQTIEAKIVDIADKWDAVGEILHDVRCGNKQFANLMDFSVGRFKTLAFSCYLFWDHLGTSPIFEFDKIPTSSQTKCMPTINIDDLKARSDVDRLMSLEGTDGYPMVYRTWAEINRVIFDVRPEKYIFPGWYLELWKRWNYKPSGKTTVSGIYIP